MIDAMVISVLTSIVKVAFCSINPSQIRQIIVQSISIYMVYVRFAIGIGNEVYGKKTMYSYMLLFSVFP